MRRWRRSRAREFADLVVDYLEEEFVEIYNRPEVWDEMVTTVAGHLERSR